MNGPELIHRREELGAVVPVILRYQILRRREFQDVIQQIILDRTAQHPAPAIKQIHWEVFYSLTEANLTGTKVVISDLFQMINASKSTARRALETLNILGITTTKSEPNDRRRHGVELTKPYLDALHQFVDDCALEFKELIELHDREERKKVEKELQRVEAKFQTVFDQTFQFMALLTTDGQIVDVNRASIEVFGIDHSAALGKPFSKTSWWNHSNDDMRNVENAIKRAAEGSLVRFETACPTQDGKLIHIDFSVKPVQDAEGNIVNLVAEGRNITERKRAEAALRESEERFRVALENSPVLVANMDRKLKYTWIYNPLPGFSPVSVVGKSDADLLTPEDAATLTVFKKAVLDSGVGNRQAFTLSVPGGATTMDINCEPLRDVNGAITGLTLAATNITERKQIEEALKTSEGRLRALADNSPLAIYFRDKEGRYILTNKEFARRHGGEPGDFPGKTPHDINAKELADDYLAGDRRIMEAGTAVTRDEDFTYADGVTRHLLSTKFPVYGESGTVVGVGVSSLDITDRKRMERALQENEKRLQSIIDNSPNIIALRDTEGRYLLANKEHCRLYCVKPDQIVGKTLYDFHPREISNRRLAEDKEILRTGRSVSAEREVTYPNGETRTIILVKFPLFDGNDELGGVCVISTDITAHKRQ
jgi:PAS domain S-box-containing protein